MININPANETFNILDNNETKKYKISYKYGILVEFVHITDKIDKNMKNEKKYFKKTLKEIVFFAKRYQTSIADIIYYLYDEVTRSELEVINEAFSMENISLVSSVGQFTRLRNNWLLQCQGRLVESLLIYSNIINVQNMLLDKYTPVKSFTAKYSKSIMVYKILPSANVSINWDINSICDIVDNSKTTENIPFLHSKLGNDKHIFKIFYSEEINYVYDPDIFLSFTKEKYHDGKIYIYVWNGKNINIKTSFNECVYDLNAGTIEINSNISSDDDDITELIGSIEKKLLVTFPFFRLTGGEVTSINAKLSFPNVKINLNVLYFMIDQDPLFSSYFTLFETTNLRSSGKKTLVAYHNIVLDSSQAFLKFSTNLQDNIYYLTVNVTRARNESEVEEIGIVLEHLLLYYKDNSDYYRHFIQKNVGDISEGDKILFEIPTSKGKMLAELAPEVFDISSGDVTYNRDMCQKIKQPIIIDDDEIDSWSKMLVKGAPRQIAEFPPPRDGTTKIFNYVCPDDKFPFPTLTENKFVENKETYPLLPCCGNEDRYTEYLKYGTGKFLEYYSQKENIKTNKVVSNKGPIKKTYFGWLPNIIRTHLDMSSNIKDYIQNINNLIKRRSSKDNEEVDEESSATDNLSSLSLFMKYSVGEEDSFIACILHAINSNETVNDVRIKMSKLDMSLYAQENLYLRDSALKEQILGGYIDPLLFYRGLEELYDINIYIFDSRTNEILLPYFKVSHIRNQRPDRKCILIWYYPQFKISELIVKINSFRKNDKKNAQKIFNEDVGSRLHITMQIVYSLQDDKIYRNILSSLNWGLAEKDMRKDGRWLFLAQKLDQNKKCRAFMVEDAKSGKKLLVFLPPTQPLNLTTKTFDASIKTDYNTAVSFIGYEAHSKTDEGVWFPASDQDEMLFIPLSDTSDLSSVKKTDSLSAITYGNEIKLLLDNSSDRNKIASDLTNLIWWIYLIENNKNVSTISFEKWWKSNVNVVDGPIDINFSQIEKLIIVSSTARAIEYANKFYPSVFDNGKINLTVKSNQSIMNNMMQKVKENSGLIMPIPTFISKKYTNERDFDSNNCKVFLSQNNLENWISTTLNIRNYKTFISSTEEIVNTNDISYIKYRKHIYILQQEKSKREAIYNSYQFSKSKINYYSKYDNVRDLAGKKYPYISYILRAGKLLIFENHTTEEDGDDYAEIVDNVDSIFSLLRLT